MAAREDSASKTVVRRGISVITEQLFPKWLAVGSTAMPLLVSAIIKTRFKLSLALPEYGRTVDDRGGPTN